MATTATVQAVGVTRGRSSQPGGELFMLEIPVLCSGQYATASKPSFDVLAALQNFCRGQAITGVRVTAATTLRDAFTSAGVRQTAPNGNISLSSTGNKVVTFRIDAAPSSSQQNGTGGGSEVADGVTCDGTFVFMVLAEITKAG